LRVDSVKRNANAILVFLCAKILSLSYYAYPCLLGEIRSPLARIDSVDEFNATPDDDIRLRFKDELGLSSSSPSSYLVRKDRHFPSELFISGFSLFR